MIVHELINNLVVETGFAVTQTGDAPILGAIIDTQDCQHVAFYVVIGGVATDAAVFTLSVVHGNAANLSDAIAADPACLVGSIAGAGFTGTSDGQTRKLGYTPGKGAGRRYVRPVLTPAGNTGAATVAVAAVKLPLRTP